MSVTVQLPHAGEGTHTLAIAIEVPDELLTDPTLPEQVLARVAEPIEPVIGRRRAAVSCDQLLADRGLTLDELRSRDRHRELVEARQDVALALRRDGWTLTAIGKLLHRDHTTVLHSLRRAEAREQSAGCQHDRCDLEALGGGRFCLRHYQAVVNARRAL